MISRNIFGRWNPFIIFSFFPPNTNTTLKCTKLCFSHSQNRVNWTDLMIILFYQVQFSKQLEKKFNIFTWRLFKIDSLFKIEKTKRDYEQKKFGTCRIILRFVNWKLFPNCSKLNFRLCSYFIVLQFSK